MKTLIKTFAEIMLFVFIIIPSMQTVTVTNLKLQI